MKSYIFHLPMKTMLLSVGLVFICQSLIADPVFHKFELWRNAKTGSEKGMLYVGWTNGVIAGAGGDVATGLKCLEGISYNQAISMIDKYFNDHPERWNATFTEGMMEALTVPGSACEGKNPLVRK